MSEETTVRVFWVCPIYNDAPNIPKLCDGWRRVVDKFPDWQFHFLLADDGSMDSPEQVAAEHRQDLCVEVLRSPSNQGPGDAFARAFEHLAGELNEADYVVTAEADNTSSIDTIRTMLNRAHREDLDVVLASPYAYGGGFQQTNFFRVLISACAAAYVRYVLGLQGILTTSSFCRVYRGAAVRRLQAVHGPRLLESPGFECMVELLIKIVALGLSLSEVAMKVDTSQRIGKSKMRILRTIRGYFRATRHARRWWRATS